jgi:hypothetical protein
MEMLLSGPAPNGGCTIGGGKAMLHFFRTILSIYQDYSSAACWRRSFDSNFPAFTGDQSMLTFMLNVLSKTGAPTGGPFLNYTLHALPNGPNPIYTGFSAAPMHMDVLGRITVKRGNITYRPVIVHQYDRNASDGSIRTSIAHIQAMFRCL